MARRKDRSREIDFTGVTSGGSRLPEGRYAAKIESIEEKEGRESGEPYWQVTWEVTSKKCGGRNVNFDNYSLQPQALFRLKGLLEAIGEDVPDSKMDVDPDDLEGQECIIEVMDDKQERGIFSRVVGLYPLEDGGTVDDEEDDDDPKARGGKTRSGTKPSSEDDANGDDRRATRRRSKDDDSSDDDKDDDDKDTRRSSGSRKLKKGAEVQFRDEKGKKKTGTVKKIDGDMALVEDDEGELEISTDELTVIG